MSEIFYLHWINRFYCQAISTHQFLINYDKWLFSSKNIFSTNCRLRNVLSKTIYTYLLNYFRFKVWPDVTHWVLNLFIRGVFTVFRPPKIQTLHLGAVHKRRCLKMFHFWPPPCLNFLDRTYMLFWGTSVTLPT